MFRSLRAIGAIPQRIAGYLCLLRRDPERFARLLMQLTHSALFEQRLLDMLNATPMHVRYDPACDGPPRLNVLDAAWTRSGMTGGPNTVINLACRTARHGIAVRLVATVESPGIDAAWFRRHAESLLATSDFPDVPIVSAARPEQPLPLGPGDMFLATHWSTAQQLKAVLPLLPLRRFFYMLQEFEPGFYAWSSNFALAVETYGMDYWPIVNEALLAEYLFAQPFGRLNDPATSARALVFEPAVDAALFRPAPTGGSVRPRRLLFYARPTNTRNLFGLGLSALRAAVADPVFADWEFLSIGGRGGVADLPLGHGHVMRAAPWTDYAGYGRLLAEADVLLCPMLSPHTSYPVLEMVACGGLAVTNVFATKTAEALARMSPGIVAAEASIAGLRDGLLRAARLSGTRGPAVLNMPRDWGAALDPIAAKIATIVVEQAC